MNALYFDNDIAVKLASLNLLDDSLNLLGSSATASFVLTSFEYRFDLASTRKGKQNKKLNNDVAGRLVKFVDECGRIPPAPVELVSEIAQSSGLDAGEVQMFASASKDREVIVLTGDKRAVSALKEHESSLAISFELEDRILCFEQVILGLIRANGFDPFKEHVVPLLDECGDTAIRAAFGSKQHSNDTQVSRVLNGYISELRGKSGKLLSTKLKERYCVQS